jgi:NAD+ kinase
MRLGIIANPEKYSINEPMRRVMNWCKSNHHQFCISRTFQETAPDIKFPNIAHVYDSEKDCVAESDFIIAIGGDGTMLHAAQYVKYSNAPILGINTGKLGFMANVQPEETEAALKDLEAGNFDIDERKMLQATSENGKSFIALNEFLFSKKDTSSMVGLKAVYDGYLLNHFWADGLLISTPTGSTAYNLSAGGPIVMPGTPVMIVTPINPHTLTTRPLVLPNDKKLVIEVEDQPDHILFSSDGRTYDHSLLRTTISKSNLTTKLVKLKNQNYFKTLRTKLMWGLDNRKRTEN